MGHRPAARPGARLRDPRDDGCGPGASIRGAPPIAYGMRVPSALVPAAHVWPFGLVYIARSTTICAGVAPRLSTIAPNRRPADSGKSSLTLTSVRLVGGSLTSRSDTPPSSNRIDTRT